MRLTQDLDWTGMTQRTNQKGWGGDQKALRLKSMAWKSVSQDQANGGWLLQFERERTIITFKTFRRGLRTRVEGKRMNLG